MLSLEENERLTRVGAGTPMGEYMRRFWIPFLVADELPAPDCEPVRVLLLGEALVAFRDTSGRVGLVDQGCPHRLADLWFGRNEEDGLRCTYHGWKFDVTGTCVQAPTEPAGSDFASKIHLKAYQVQEKAGVLWAYMGPPDKTPAMPDFDWMHAPEGHIHVSWSIQECNFAQAIEGGIDTAHSVYLHSTVDSHHNLEQWKQQGKRTNSPQMQFRTNDNPPQLFAKDTDYGVLIGGKYPGNEGEDYWRFNQFLLPFYTMPPGQPRGAFAHAFTPLDDVTCTRWVFWWNAEAPLTSLELAGMRSGRNGTVPLLPGAGHTPLRNKRNNYLLDREEQRTLTFTGIAGGGEQDFSVQEGMGPVVDRTREHLGMSDIGIIQMRRRLLKEASQLQEGQEPATTSRPEVYRVHAGHTMLPAGVPDWAEAPKTKAVQVPLWAR